MKALILAAGRGRRLWPFTADRPKCLLRVGELSLLARQLHHLRQVGVDAAVVVCGFGAEQVRAALSQMGVDMAVKLLYNPFYATADNLISLWAARSEMDGEFLLLNGDNIFHPQAVQTLLDAGGECQLLAGHKESYGRDDMKILLAGGHLRRIGKDIAGAEAVSLGIVRFGRDSARALGAALEEIVAEKGALVRHFPAAIQYMIDRGHSIGCCFAPHFPCTDVDTPADLRAVRRDLHLYCQGSGAHSRAGGHH